MTHNMWHMTGGWLNLLSKCQVPSTYGLGVKFSEDISTESVNDKGVCRTAPATLGLLIISVGLKDCHFWAKGVPMREM